MQPSAHSKVATLPPAASFHPPFRPPACPPAAITIVYLALAYSLLTAYCTKAAEVLDFFAGGGLPPLVGAAGFVGGVGGLLYLGGTRAADSLNQVGMRCMHCCTYCCPGLLRRSSVCLAPTAAAAAASAAPTACLLAPQTHALTQPSTTTATPHVPLPCRA